MKKIKKWIIVRDNGETYVTWAETRAEAVAEFHSRGYAREKPMAVICGSK